MVYEEFHKGDCQNCGEEVLHEEIVRHRGPTTVVNSYEYCKKCGFLEEHVEYYENNTKKLKVHVKGNKKDIKELFEKDSYFGYLTKEGEDL